MASGKEPSRQSEREKTQGTGPSEGGPGGDQPRRDSDFASEREADVNRDAERVEADKAKRQSRSASDSSRDLGRADVGRSGAERQAEGDERLRVEREASDEAIDAERFRADAATEMGRTHHHASAKSSADLLSREQESHRKTKTALTTREEFLAIVSHDLRNPLNNIFMAAQNLLEEPGESQEAKAIASSINRSAGEMLRLIQDLLDIERIAIGKLILHYEKHDISEIIKDVVGAFKRDAASKEITLTAKPDAGCSEVICDRNRVVQVLSNLVGNAIKFTPAKGQICVSCAQTGPGGKDVQVSVSDTGAGIAPEKINTIFERFSQINSQDRRGIGLGLYIAKNDGRRASGKNMGRVEARRGQHVSLHSSPSLWCDPLKVRPQ